MGLCFVSVVQHFHNDIFNQRLRLTTAVKNIVIVGQKFIFLNKIFFKKNKIRLIRIFCKKKFYFKSFPDLSGNKLF